MTVSPPSTRSGRTRLHILEAARRLLEEHGYHGTGLEAVAASAGVSRQSIYLHFGSKAQLMLALVAHVDEEAGLAELAEAAWRDRMESRRRRCRQIVGRLTEEGRLAPGWSQDEAADLLWATSGLRVWEDLVAERGWSTERFRRRLQQVLRQALV